MFIDYSEPNVEKNVAQRLGTQSLNHFLRTKPNKGARNVYLETIHQQHNT